MALAKSSLPVPLSPRKETTGSVRASRRAMAMTSMRAGLEPTISRKVTCSGCETALAISLISRNSLRISTAPTTRPRESRMARPVARNWKRPRSVIRSRFNCR